MNDHPVCPYDGTFMLVEERIVNNDASQAPHSDQRTFAITARCQRCDCAVAYSDRGLVRPESARVASWARVRAEFYAQADVESVRRLNDERRAREAAERLKDEPADA